MLAVCHTVMVEPLNPNSPVSLENLKYSASSPDELALVMGSKEVGIVYNKRTSTTLTIVING